MTQQLVSPISVRTPVAVAVTMQSNEIVTANCRRPSEASSRTRKRDSAQKYPRSAFQSCKTTVDPLRGGDDRVIYGTDSFL